MEFWVNLIEEYTGRVVRLGNYQALTLQLSSVQLTYLHYFWVEWRNN